MNDCRCEPTAPHPFHDRSRLVLPFHRGALKRGRLLPAKVCPMKPNTGLFIISVFITVVLCVPSHSAEIRLSGTVTDLSGKFLSGVGIALAKNGNATSTNSSGAWGFSSALAGIVVPPKQTPVSAMGHLEVNGRRLRVRHDHVDVVGRKASGSGGFDAGGSKVAGFVSARLAEASVDTLLFSWNGSVCARVGISSLEDGELGSQAIDTSKGGVGSTAPWKESITYGVFVDARDGQRYRTTTIGTQTWMAENLNFKVDSSWWYNESADSGAKYGRLYAWNAAMNLSDTCNRSTCASLLQTRHQGICPRGWHVPNDAEWNTLEAYRGAATTGLYLRSTSGWSVAASGISGNGFDSFGFRALPAGDRTSRGDFDNAGSYANFWRTTEYHAYLARSRTLRSGVDDLYRSDASKNSGFSVRCLKDGL